ncbi:MAG TPA: glycosyltransferase family 39 protein [Gemmataceae bacterium]|nr:glycosyltransferase family 39 protein [Gemmataceae bacterium]
MFQRLNHRAGPYALLLLLAGPMFLVNLGGPSLWDIDEGNNAEAAREMLERDNWVVPTFNYQLRVDKPALLYWLQIAAYQWFGVNEFSARLPSALAALVTVLLTYELGRLMFGRSTGLLAGVVLASAVQFCAAAHFANPDPLFNAFTVLALLVFWIGFALGWRGWFVGAGAASGLAVLAKGPAGLLLPFAVVVLFLLWSRRLGLLADRRLVLGVLAFFLVAAPWYACVGAETKAEFLEEFILTHNIGRYLSPMQNHRGPVFYYLVVLMVGLAPWSVFLPLAGGDIFKTLRGQETSSADARSAVRFLGCWIAAYLVFFSLSRTKLPGYILPVFAPAAILIARALDRWRQGAINPPAWVMKLSLVGLGLIGVGVAVGLLLAGGAFAVPFLRGRRLPGLEAWAAVGVVPMLGAAAAGWLLRRGHRAAVVASCAAAAVLFVGAAGIHGGITLDAHKAPKPLAQVILDHQPEPEVRIAVFQYFQPSLVFYCQREVKRLENDREALDFLRSPLPAYLVLPAATWDRLAQRAGDAGRLLARRRDFYRNCDVVVVTNR